MVAALLPCAANVRATIGAWLGLAAMLLAFLGSFGFIVVLLESSILDFSCETASLQKIKGYGLLILVFLALNSQVILAPSTHLWGLILLELFSQPGASPLSDLGSATFEVDMYLLLIRLWNANAQTPSG